MRPATALPVALLAALAVTSAAPAASPDVRVPRDAAAARALERQRVAIELLNRATQDVRRSRAACRPDVTGLDAQPPLTGAPDPAVLAALAPLRRPATPDDLAALGTGSEGSFAHGPGAVYSNYVRQVTAANGKRLVIVVARVAPLIGPRPSSCLRAETARLDALLAGQPADVGRLARRYLRSSHRGERRARGEAPHDGIFTYSFGPNGTGGGGGGGDARRFLRYGNFGSTGRAGRTEVDGLVPDGVAAIRFDYPRRESRGRYYKPRVYARAIHRTVRVHDNAVDFHLARDAANALPRRMTWLAADGHVLRVVRP